MEMITRIFSALTCRPLILPKHGYKADPRASVGLIYFSHQETRSNTTKWKCAGCHQCLSSMFREPSRWNMLPSKQITSQHTGNGRSNKYLTVWPQKKHLDFKSTSQISSSHMNQSPDKHPRIQRSLSTILSVLLPARQKRITKKKNKHNCLEECSSPNPTDDKIKCQNTKVT